METKGAVIPKLSIRETLGGFDVCRICGAKYRWSPGGDCPNLCKSKASQEECEQEKLVATETQRLVLVKKLEAIGYVGEELQSRAREIQAQIVAASLLPHPPAVSARTIAKGVLLANFIVAAAVFLLLLFIKLLTA